MGAHTYHYPFCSINTYPDLSIVQPTKLAHFLTLSCAMSESTTTTTTTDVGESKMKIGESGLYDLQQVKRLLDDEAIAVRWHNSIIFLDRYLT